MSVCHVSASCTLCPDLRVLPVAPVCRAGLSLRGRRLARAGGLPGTRHTMTQQAWLVSLATLDRKASAPWKLCYTRCCPRGRASGWCRVTNNRREKGECDGELGDVRGTPGWKLMVQDQSLLAQNNYSEEMEAELEFIFWHN